MLGGCIFAEHPDTPAPGARLFWTAECDPFVLTAEPRDTSCGLRLDRLKLPLQASVLEREGRAHLVFLSEGRRVAVDLSARASDLGATGLSFRVDLGAIGTQALALQRLKALLETRTATALWPPVRRGARFRAMLTVLDARAQGASLREAGERVFGCTTVRAEWNGSSDFLKSRMRRLARDAAAMRDGGYRQLLGPGSDPARALAASSHGVLIAVPYHSP